VAGHYQPILFTVLVAFVPCVPAPRPYVATEQSARLARSSGIAMGVRPRPPRKTRAEKLRESDIKFGLVPANKR
jgi:hypothetical protein